MSYPIDLTLKPSELMFGLFNYHNNHTFDGADVSFSDAKSSDKVEYPDRVTVHSNVEIAGVDVPRAVVHYTRIDINRLFSVCRLELLDKWLTPTIDFDKIKEVVLYRYGVNIEDGFTVHSLTNRSGGFALTAALSNVAYKGSVEIAVVPSLSQTRVQVKALDGLKHVKNINLNVQITRDPKIPESEFIQSDMALKFYSLNEGVDIAARTGNTQNESLYMLNVRYHDYNTGRRKEIPQYDGGAYKLRGRFYADEKRPLSGLLSYCAEGSRPSDRQSTMFFPNMSISSMGSSNYPKHQTSKLTNYIHSLYDSRSRAIYQSSRIYKYTNNVQSLNDTSMAGLYGPYKRLDGNIDLIITRDGWVAKLNTLSYYDKETVMPLPDKIHQVEHFSGAPINLGSDGERYYVSNLDSLKEGVVWSISLDGSESTRHECGAEQYAFLNDYTECQSTLNALYFTKDNRSWDIFRFKVTL